MSRWIGILVVVSVTAGCQRGAAEAPLGIAEAGRVAGGAAADLDRAEHRHPIAASSRETAGELLTRATAMPVVQALPDLGGVWPLGDGLLVLDGRRALGSRYSAHLIRDGEVCDGTAAFDGRDVVVELHEVCSVGVTGALDRVLGGRPGPPRVLTFRFERDRTGAHLVGPSGRTARWSLGKPDQIEAVARRLPASEQRSPSGVSPALLLARFVSREEAAWRAAGEGPTTRLPAGALPELERYRAQKAIDLARLGRSPRSLTEGFADARGSVAGEQIEPRRLFWQRWEPTARPSGRVVAVFPGYAQTGRAYADAIQRLNDRGDLVYVFDQPWAGFTRGGSPGAVDRGYGVVRDVAAALAFVAREAPGRELVPFGYSLSGGALLGALLLNDRGEIDLAGGRMPRALSAVVENPYFSPAPSVESTLFGLATSLGLGSVVLPADRLVPSNYDSATRAVRRDQIRAENAMARTDTPGRVSEDLEALRRRVEAGERPLGRVTFLHGDQDVIADAEVTREVARMLGDRGAFVPLHGGTHLDVRPGTWEAVMRAIAGESLDER